MQQTSTLNTPVKRIGLLILLAGLSMLVIGLAIVAFDTSHLNYYWSHVVEYWNRPFRGRLINLLHYGMAFATLGLLLSYLYDQTTGRLIKWIRYGK